MTPFGALAALAGLSHREAADFLAMRLDSVKSAVTGRRAAPPGAIADLAALITAQEHAARETLMEIEAAVKKHGPVDGFDLGYPADDHEAALLGFPCVGAWGAMAARIVAASPVPIRMSPRGASLPTAAAVDEHER